MCYLRGKKSWENVIVEQKVGQVIRKEENQRAGRLWSFLMLRNVRETMKTKTDVEKKIEEIENQLIKNQKDFREGVLNNDHDKSIYASIRIKILEEKLVLLKWILQ